MASNKLNGYGIGPEKVINIKKIYKGGEGDKKWACINCSDSAKSQNGYKTLGYFCIWVQNKEVIDDLKLNTQIKITNINKIYYSESSYNGKTSTVVNVIANIEIANNNIAQSPEDEYANTPTQSYAGETYSSNDDYDLPNW